MLIIGFIRNFFIRLHEERVHKRKLEEYHKKRCAGGEHDWGKWIEHHKDWRDEQYRYCLHCGIKEVLEVPRYRLRR